MVHNICQYLFASDSRDAAMGEGWVWSAPTRPMRSYRPTEHACMHAVATTHTGTQNKAGQCSAVQGRAVHARAGQCRPEQCRPGQARPGQCRSVQCRPGQLVGKTISWETTTWYLNTIQVQNSIWYCVLFTHQLDSCRVQPPPPDLSLKYRRCVHGLSTMCV